MLYVRNSTKFGTQQGIMMSLTKIFLPSNLNITNRIPVWPPAGATARNNLPPCGAFRIVPIVSL